MRFGKRWDIKNHDGWKCCETDGLTNKFHKQGALENMISSAIYNNDLHALQVVVVTHGSHIIIICARCLCRHPLTLNYYILVTCTSYLFSIRFPLLLIDQSVCFILTMRHNLLNNFLYLWRFQPGQWKYSNLVQIAWKLNYILRTNDLVFKNEEIIAIYAN